SPQSREHGGGSHVVWRARHRVSMSPAEELVARGPGGVGEWLRAVREGRVAAPAEFNWWLALLTVLTSEARREADGNGALEWAAVALQAHDLVASREGADSAFSVEELSAYLRLHLIASIGARSGHPVLDPERVLRWIVSGL